MQHEQFSVAWMRLWMSGYHLGLAFQCTERQQLEKNSNFYWNLLKLYSTQNWCVHVFVPYTIWLPVSWWRRVISRESPSHYSICPSQLKYQMKNFWLKTGVLYEQLCSVPFATLWPIYSSMFMFFVYWTTHQLL